MLIEVLSGLFAGAIGGFVGGSITGYFAGWQFSTALDMLKKRVDTLWGSTNSEKGVEARTLNATQEAAIMAQAVALWQSNDSDKMQKLVALAAQNPQMTQRLLKKFGVV
jgi:uncharacterized protein with von Willebrand factor type A (vWA) domain